MPTLPAWAMGWTSLAGLILLGFGPALALNALIIFRRSQLLIVEITGCGHPR